MFRILSGGGSDRFVAGVWSAPHRVQLDGALRKEGVERALRDAMNRLRSVFGNTGTGHQALASKLKMPVDDVWTTDVADL